MKQTDYRPGQHERYRTLDNAPSILPNQEQMSKTRSPPGTREMLEAYTQKENFVNGSSQMPDPNRRQYILSPFAAYSEERSVKQKQSKQSIESAPNRSGPQENHSQNNYDFLLDPDAASQYLSSADNRNQRTLSQEERHVQQFVAERKMHYVDESDEEPQYYDEDYDQETKLEDEPQHMTPEPLSPEGRHLRTIQEDLQERSNSVVSRDKLRSIPASDDAAYEDINNNSKSPRRNRSVAFPTTYRSTSRKEMHVQTPNQVIHSERSQITEKSTPTAKKDEDQPDPFDELCHAKLSLMAEKTANRFVMKELLTQITLINDLFYRKQVQHEMLLHSESDVQLKTILELSHAPNETSLNSNLRKQIIEETRNKSNRLVSDEIRIQCDRVLKRFNDIMQGESHILNSLAKEKERNAFLENELSKRDFRTITSGKTDTLHRQSLPEAQDEFDRAEAEGYIQELEAHLQHTRQELLNAKLQISDLKVDNTNLQTKLVSCEEQLHEAMDDNRSFETIIDKVKQQVQVLEQEKLVQSANYQKMKEISDIAMSRLQHSEEIMQQMESQRVTISSMPFAKDTQSDYLRQIDFLQRQLVELQKANHSMEMVEQNLMQKVDKKTHENSELKALINDLRAQLDMKNEAIGKAQKIIEKLTEKADVDEQMIQSMQAEVDRLKKEVAVKQTRSRELQLQLDDAHKRSQVQIAQLNEAMNRELLELKDAIKAYQQELSVEKLRYSEQIESLNDDLQQRVYERDEWCHRVKELESEMAGMIRQKEDELRKVTELGRQAQLKVKEQEDQIKNQFELKIAEQTGHIQYLQRRIKEIVDETQDKEEFRRPDELTSAAIKKELDTLGTEVIAIRDVLRAEQRKEGAMVNIKVSTYDEFRLRVLDELIIWDIKSAELAKAATQYHEYLEEQRRMFKRVQKVVVEKDRIIDQLHIQLHASEQAHQQAFDALKLDFHMQNKMVMEDFGLTIKLLEKKCEVKEKACKEMADRLDVLKREFSLLMDEKDSQDVQFSKVRADLETLETGYLNLKQLNLRNNERLAEIMNVNSEMIPSLTQRQVSDLQIERAVKGLVDDNRTKCADLQTLKEKLATLEKVKADEMSKALEKFQKLEQEFSEHRSQASKVEDRYRTEYTIKENEIKQELKTAEAYAEKVSGDAQIRERQLKKLQQKREDDLKKMEEMQTLIARLAHEKQEVLSENERAEQKICDYQRKLEEMLVKCEQTKEIYQQARQEIATERQRVKEAESKIHEQHKQLLLEQAQGERSRDQFDHLDMKLHALERRSEEQQKDNEELFKQANDAVIEKDRLAQQVKVLREDKVKQEQDLVLARSDITYYQLELKNFENTVVRLTKELDEQAEKDQLIEELQSNLQTFDQQIDLQANQIISLQDQLRGPKKASAMIQTEEAGMLELQYARQGVIMSQMAADEANQEAAQLREALARSQEEICWLIEDKRELEELIEKLNQGINQTRRSNTQLGKSYQLESVRKYLQSS